MRAGRLNRKITIRDVSASRTATGAVSGTPTTVATPWAERMDTAAQETWRGRQIAAEIVAVFRVRHRTDVKPRMQVVDGTEVFEIEGVQLAEQSGGGFKALDLLCRRPTVR